MVTRLVNKNIILFIVAIAQFMVVLDSSIVNVALPSMYKSLGFTSTSSLQWVVTAYTLTFGGFLLLGGRAADLYGRKRLFMVATGVFATVSLLAGLAQSPLMIEITRAIQGLAAAFMSPAALSIVLTTFKEGKERAKALSIWGAVAAGGAAVGVLLGGVLTEYLDWRWNFFVNVPVGIAVAIAAHRYVPESKADLTHSKLDLPGAVLVTSGLMVMVFAFSKGAQYGWTSTRIIELFALSIILVGGFVYNESRSKHALMPLGIFKIRNVAAANVAQLPIIAAMFSMFFFVTLYIQNVLHYSPIKTGLSFLPVPIVIGIISVAMQKVIGRVGYRKPLLVSPLIIASGLFVLSHLSVGGNYAADVLPGLLIIAAGMGMTFIAITIAATTGVAHNQSGLASGLLNTSQQIGGALGLAILSGISASAVTANAALGTAGAQVAGFNAALRVGIFFALFSAAVIIVFMREQKGKIIDGETTMAVS